MNKERKDLIIFAAILTITFLLFSTSKCKAQSLEKDKALHFYYGAFTSGLATTIYCNETYNKPLKNKVLIAVGTAFTVGLCKELYDTRRGGSGFDYRDLLATTLGALPVTIVLKIDSKKNKKRKTY